MHYPLYLLWAVVGVGLTAQAATLAAEERLPAGFPVRKGPLTLARASELAQPDMPEGELQWLSRFELIVTNGYEFAAPQVSRALGDAGCQVFRYLWANGFTTVELAADMPDGDWRRVLLEQHPEWLLSREALPGPPGTPASYYFDFTQRGLIDFLARQVAATRRKGLYGGTLFDYAGAYPLPAEVVDLWHSRHPDTSYDQALAEFFTRLRAIDPGGIIFTNQACLGDVALLPTADYDLVESYGTSYLWGPTVTIGGRDHRLSFLRPWTGPGSLQQMYEPLIQTLRSRAPRKRLLCLDYMRPALTQQAGEVGEVPDMEAVYYSYCAAALWGLDSFCSGWYGLPYRGPLYFADLGAPLGDAPLEVAGLAIREYERGLVALMTSPHKAEAALKLTGAECSELYDLFSGRRIPCQDRRLTLTLDPLQRPAGGPGPRARLYLKLHTRP